MMNKNEKEALLNYLEYHLMVFLENVDEQVEDDEAMIGLYEEAYGILEDVDDTVETSRIMNALAERGKH